MKILALHSSSFALKVARFLDKPLVIAQTEKFPNQEIKVILNENYNNETVFILSCFSRSLNERLIELFLLIDTVKQMSPRNIILVMPYLYYARQDHAYSNKESLALRSIATILCSLGVTKIISMDIHSKTALNFFQIPTIILDPSLLFCLKIQANQPNLQDIIVVAPDEGSKSRAIELSKQLLTSYAIISKQRNSPRNVEILNIKGKVTNKICYLVDDIVDTASTLVAATKFLLSQGAKEVRACITHAIFSEDAIDKINKSSLKSLITTNSIEVDLAIKCKKINIIDIAKVFADEIKLLDS